MLQVIVRMDYIYMAQDCVQYCDILTTVMIFELQKGAKSLSLMSRYQALKEDCCFVQLIIYLPQPFKTFHSEII
jgi:hypothetical protein